MAESLADLNLPGFPGQQERLLGGGGEGKAGPPQSVRVRSLGDDFSPSPPPQINYRSGEAEEGLLCRGPVTRRAHRHIPLSTHPRG